MVSFEFGHFTDFEYSPPLKLGGGTKKILSQSIDISPKILIRYYFLLYTPLVTLLEHQLTITTPTFLCPI